MPELPEVESVRQALEEKIIGEKIIDINLYYDKNLRNVAKNELNKIINQKIISIDRKAKHLILRFEANYLICHLRMEGKFLVYDHNDPKYVDKTMHHILQIKTDKHIIIFEDFRRFATIDMFENTINYNQNPILIKIASEPFNIDLEELFKKISKKNVSIKTILLDQSIISGLGNIYVDEVLFAANIFPTSKGVNISKEQVEKIVEESKRILKLAIYHKGTTIKSFVSQLGTKGNYQNFLTVHSRKNLPCKKCGNNIEKTVVGGRGTYYCSDCQIKY